VASYEIIFRSSFHAVVTSTWTGRLCPIVSYESSSTALKQTNGGSTMSVWIVCADG